MAVSPILHRAIAYCGASFLSLPRESVGRGHRRPSAAVLKKQNADALHRLCAKRRSSGGADVAVKVPHGWCFLKTATPARSRSLTPPTWGRVKTAALRF